MAFIQNEPGKIKSSPEFRVLVYPESAIGKIDGGGWGVVDVIRQLVKRDGGDSAHRTYAPPEGKNIVWDFGTHTVTNNPYLFQKQFERIDETIEYIEVNASAKTGTGAVRASGDKSDPSLAGFALRCRAIPLNSRIRSEGNAFGKAPDGDPLFPPLEWVPRSPGAREGEPAWETVLPYRSPFMTAIKCTRNVPNITAAIETSAIFPRDQSMEFRIIWDGVAQGHTQGAGYRISWGGGTHSILWSQGRPPSYQQKIGGSWVLIRELEDAPGSTFRGTDTVRIRSLLGRLVIAINGRSWAIAGKRQLRESGGESDELRRLSWPEGRVHVSQFGAQAVLSVSLLYHFDEPTARRFMLLAKSALAASKSPKVSDILKRLKLNSNSGLKGVFKRRFPRSIPPGVEVTVQDFRTATAGDKPPGTAVTVKLDVAGPEIRYECSLLSGSSPVYTPFVSTVMLQRKSSSIHPSELPIDLSDCFVRGSEISGEPGVMPGANWSLTFDARLLDLEFPDGAWKQHLKTFNPITFEVRWRYEDCTYSEWVGRLHGYIYPLSANSDGFNKGEVTVQAADPVIRLTAPNAIVDHEYLPLDFLFASNDGRDPNRPPGSHLYGADCVHEILRVALGDQVADSMNGGTSGEQRLRYFEPGHYPIYSASSDVLGYLPSTSPESAASSGDSPLLPAPFGDAPLNWINQISGWDFAAFYFGFPSSVNEDGTVAFGSRWPVPIYGWYWAIVANRPTWQVSDAIYDHAEEFNQAVLSGSMGDMPEWMINRVLVWGGNKESDNVLFPSAFMAEARLNSDDPGSQERTWPRTLLENNPVFMQVPGALVARVMMTLAHLELRLFVNKRIRRVHLKFVGEERMGWGDKIVPKMRKNSGGDSSPSHLDLDGETFRVVKLTNTYDTTKPGTEQFTTSASCAPFNQEYEG